MAELDLDERSQVIGENLRKYRLLKGLRQEEVAKGLCSVSQLSKVENGKTALKPSLLKQVADRLGVTVEQLESTDAYQEELRETLVLANTAFAAGNIDKSLELVRTVIEKSAEGGYPDLYTEALLLEVREMNRIQQHVAVIARVEQVLADGMQMDTVIKVNLLAELGRAYEMQGNMRLAFENFYRADEEFQTIETIDERCMRDLYVLAVAHWKMRNYRTGLRYITKVEQIAEDSSRHTWRIYSLNLKARLLTALGEVEKARAIFPKALEEAKKQSLIPKVGDIQNNFGCLYMSIGEYGEAQAHFGRAVKIYELLGDQVEMCKVYLNLAEVACQEQEFSRAEGYLQQVGDMLAQHPESFTYMHKARCHHLRGKLRAAEQDFAGYVQELETALHIFDQHEVVLEAYDVAVELADAMYENGDEQAVRLYRKAVDYRNKSRSFGMKK